MGVPRFELGTFGVDHHQVRPDVAYQTDALTMLRHTPGGWRAPRPTGRHLAKVSPLIKVLSLKGHVGPSPTLSSEG